MTIDAAAGAVDPFLAPPTTKTVQVPLAEPDWDLLTEHAEAAGLSRPALVRAVLRQAGAIRPLHGLPTS